MKLRRSLKTEKLLSSSPSRTSVLIILNRFRGDSAAILQSTLRLSIRGYFLPFTIDTEIKAKRNNIISGLVTFRITKAKAKVKFGVKYLCGHECERSSVQLISLGNSFHFNFRVNGTFRGKNDLSR